MLSAPLLESGWYPKSNSFESMKFMVDWTQALTTLFRNLQIIPFKHFYKVLHFTKDITGVEQAYGESKQGSQEKGCTTWLSNF